MQHVIKSSRDTLSKQKPTPKSESLQKTVDDIERRWTNIHSKVTKRYTQINRIIPNANTYNKEYDTFDDWIDDAEKRFKLLPVLTSNTEEIVVRKRDLKVSNFM